MVRKIWIGFMSLIMAIIISYLLQKFKVDIEKRVMITVICGIGLAFMWIKAKERRY